MGPRRGGPQSSKGDESPVAVGRGFVGGIGAFVATYLIIYITKSGQGSYRLAESFGWLVDGDAVPAQFDLVGFLFFEAHNVVTTAKVSRGTQTEIVTGSLTQTQIWDPWLFLVPVITLVGVGFMITKSVTATSAADGFKVGAAVVLGYLTATVIGIVMFVWNGPTGVPSVTVGPDLVTGILLAGLAYPIILGGIGGAIAAET